MSKRAAVLLLAVVALSAALAPRAWAQPASPGAPSAGPRAAGQEIPTYIVEFLPNPDPDPATNPRHPEGINEGGDATGYFDWPYRAFVYTDEGGTVFLPNLPGRSFGLGAEINDLEQVAGRSGFDSIDDPERAVRWVGGAPQEPSAGPTAAATRSTTSDTSWAPPGWTRAPVRPMLSSTPTRPG